VLRGRVLRVCIRGVQSSWIEVLSGVPHGSVLGPILFLIYINDLDFGIKNWILKFADDTKNFSRINNSLDSEQLQSDMRQLIRWSEEHWQMLFNVNKCKVMHIAKQNQQRQYFMHDQCLEVVCQEKDLGILISNSDVKLEFFSKSKLESKKSIKTQNLFFIVS